MTFLSHISPFRAYRDLRGFLAARRPYELGFMLLALLVTFMIIFVFVKDSRVETPYRPNIIYVESWPITRSEAEIRAQQRIDAARQQQEAAVLAETRKARQAEFKKYDDWLKKHGI